MHPTLTALTHSSGYKVTISTLGAGIVSLTYHGYPLLETYNDPSNPPLNANLVLAPWPNRLNHGSFEYEGRNYNLPKTEPGRDNAIHGLVTALIWTIDSKTESSITMSADIGPNQERHLGSRSVEAVDSASSWPWDCNLTITYSLSSAGLQSEFACTNRSNAAMPCAYGVHTYVTGYGAAVDSSTLTFTSDFALKLDHKRLLPEYHAATSHPQGKRPQSDCSSTNCLTPHVHFATQPCSSAFSSSTTASGLHGSQSLHLGSDKFEDPASTESTAVSLNLDGKQCDGCFHLTTHTSDDRPVASATIQPESTSSKSRNPELKPCMTVLNSDGQGVMLSVDETFEWTQIFIADPENGYEFPGRGRALAFEPMTAPPDALNNGVGLAHISPQDTWTSVYQISAVEAQQ